MSDKRSDGAGLGSLGLQNRLLEVAVVVGMDNDTGLQLRKIENSGEVSVTKSIFEHDFQGFLLDILSGPQENVEKGGKSNGDPIESVGTAFKKFSLKRRNATMSRQDRSNKPKPMQRGVSVRRLRKKANAREEVPVSTDFLGNMPSVCLPDESKVYKDQRKSSIHPTVLTDIDGFRHYAVILTFYRQFYATKTGAEYWTLENNVNSGQRCIVNGNDHGPHLCYVPCCVCFVSTEPYLSVFKDALSCLHKEFSSSPGSLRKVVEKYVTNLSLVVCPPPSVKIRFSLGSLPVILPSSNLHESIIDVDLRLPLFIFLRQPTVLMNVLACIMHEQRIVFFSSDFTLIPLVMECFLRYIRPFHWQHQYIPTLFSEIIGFVECPGIFMMGCHSRHRPEVEKIENDLFLVDLDHGTIQTNSHSSTETDNGRIGQFALDMPDFAVQNLLVRLGDFQLHNSVTSVCQVNPVTLEEIREHNLNIRQSVNEKILNIFMEFMVDLFGSTLQYLDHEHQQFNSNKFLESINPMDSPFYIKVSKSYMFRRFIRQRLKRSSDHFSAVAAKRTEAKLLSKSQRNLRSNSLRERSDSLKRKSSLFFPDNLAMDHFSDKIETPATRIPGPTNGFASYGRRSELTLVLPTFPVQGTNFNSKHFYQRCINSITENLEKLPTNTLIHDYSSQRAALLFLRGVYHLAEENLVQGLKDLTATAKEDARFYPEEILKKVALALSQQELRSVQHHSLLKNVKLSSLKPLAIRTHSVVRNEVRSYFMDDNTAVYSLGEEPFAFVLEKEEVTTDKYVLTMLFDALRHCSEPPSMEVEPEIFNAFNQTWQQLKSECKKAYKNLGEEVCRVPIELQSPRSSRSGIDDYLTFQYDENVLKISEVVLSNKGNGRLILTSKRLIFISAGNNECKEVIQLEKILYLKEGKIKNFLSSTPALFITQENARSDSRFKIGLKSKCSLWINLIDEIRTGQKRSQDQCDDNIALKSASQNVLIANAFYSSVTEEGYMKPAETLEWVSKLCKFQSQKQSGELTSFSPETQEMLMMLKDLSPKESKKSGVRAMAYSSAGIDETPHIFTMLNSGKLRLLDTTTWDLDAKPIKEWETNPTCLLLVEDKELWVGGEDTNIYVLSLTTMKIMRILHDHEHAVVSITHAKDGLIASADRAGKVIIWQHESTQVLKSFEAYDEPVDLISMMTYKELLCFCSTIHILISDYEGNQMQRFEPGETPAVPHSNLTCFTWQDNNEIWAGDDHGAIYTWDVNLTGSYLTRRTSSSTRPKLAGVISDTSITCMIKYGGKLWAGNTEGEIIIFNTDEPRQERSIKAHSGPVTAVLALENRYMVSTSGEDDGKLILWRQYHK